MYSPTGVPDQTSLAPAMLDASLVENWTVVATKTVVLGHITKMKGSRYSLVFPPRCVRADLTVTVRERDADIVDVDLGPEGSTFFRPVTLKINYKGTANDPGQPDYNGAKPQVFLFNPVSQNWTPVPGTDDPKSLTYTVKLSHFSRYAMGDATVIGGPSGGSHENVN